MSFQLVETKCQACGCFPCQCRLSRTEACACGGTIVAANNYEPYVLAAVRSHQKTVLHVAWRRRMGYQ